MPPADDYTTRAARMAAAAEAAHRSWYLSLSPEDQARLVLLDLHQHSPDKYRVSGHSPNEDRDPATSSLARTPAAAPLPESESEPDPASTPPPPTIHAFASPIIQRVIGCLMTDPDTIATTGALAFALDLHDLNNLGTPKSWAAEKGLKPAAFTRKIQWWRQELDLPAIPPNQLRDIRRVVGGLIGEHNVKISCAALAFALNLDAIHGIPTLRDWVATHALSPAAISKKKLRWERDLQLRPNAHSKTEKAKTALSKAQSTNHWRRRPWTATARKSKSKNKNQNNPPNK